MRMDKKRLEVLIVYILRENSYFVRYAKDVKATIILANSTVMIVVNISSVL